MIYFIKETQYINSLSDSHTYHSKKVVMTWESWKNKIYNGFSGSLQCPGQMVKDLFYAGRSSNGKLCAFFLALQSHKQLQVDNLYKEGEIHHIQVKQFS